MAESHIIHVHAKDAPQLPLSQGRPESALPQNTAMADAPGYDSPFLLCSTLAAEALVADWPSRPQQHSTAQGRRRHLSNNQFGHCCCKAHLRVRCRGSSGVVHHIQNVQQAAGTQQPGWSSVPASGTGAIHQCLLQMTAQPIAQYHLLAPQQQRT